MSTIHATMATCKATSRTITSLCPFFLEERCFALFESAQESETAENKELRIRFISHCTRHLLPLTATLQRHCKHDSNATTLYAPDAPLAYAPIRGIVAELGLDKRPVWSGAAYGTQEALMVALHAITSHDMRSGCAAFDAACARLGTPHWRTAADKSAIFRGQTVRWLWRATIQHPQ